MDSQHAVANEDDRAQSVHEQAEPESRPKLVFVYGETCGHSRRVEAFLAQVLQRRHNHETFDLVRVCAEEQPELVEQLGVSEVPTLLVIDQRRIEARVVKPTSQVAIKSALGRWLK